MICDRCAHPILPGEPTRSYDVDTASAARMVILHQFCPVRVPYVRRTTT